MEKTRTPINESGENSSGNNQAENSPTKNSTAKTSSNNNRKKLVSQNMLLQFIQAEAFGFARWIHINFLFIMYTFIGINLGFLFIGNKGNHASVVSTFICLVCIVFRQYADKQKDNSTLDKFANFKRFTHKRANGRIDIKPAEIEQIILYLYELEEYLGKPDKDE